MRASPPLRLLVVSAHAVLGGAEAWLLALLDATDRLDVEAIVLSEGPLVGEFERRGVVTTVRPVGRRPVEQVAPMLWLAAELRRRRPEVVLANGVKAAIHAVPAANLAGVPVVWAKHDHTFDSWAAPVLAALCDGVVAAVEELAQATRRADAVVVPPPRPALAPAERPEAVQFWRQRGLDLDEGQPTLVMLGRLVPYKGVDTAVAALAHARATSWNLAVIGEDDPASPGEEHRLRALADSLGVGQRVAFCGHVPEAGRWLAAFDALAVLTHSVGPGTPQREGFGTSAFEAMLAGIPVIAAGGGAVVRRLGGEAGWEVGSGAPAALADVLASAADPAVRARAGEAGRRILATHPDATTCARQLTAALAAAAARPGAGLATNQPVSVVVTVRDEQATIDDLLDTVVPQLGPGDEVVVVDGGSSDNTVARVRDRSSSDERVRLIEAPGTNIPAGRNRGVDAAAHAVVATTDAGCEARPGWLDALRTGMAEHPAPAVVAGVYVVSGRTPLERAMALACYADPDERRRPTLLTRVYGKLLGRSFDPTLPATRSLAFQRSAWARVGGFPEHLDTAEDPVFGRRVAAAGGRCVLAADAEVVWAQRPTLAATARMYHRYGVGDGRSGDRLLLARNGARAAAYLALPWLAAGGRRRRALGAAATASAAYLSVPLVRAVRHRADPGAVALIPAALAVKDLAKISGCVRGLLSSR